MSNGRKEYTFLWIIENYSYYWQLCGQVLLSPKFHFHGLEGAAWKLAICPRGREDQDMGFVSVFLFRDSEDLGPQCIRLKFRLSFLAVDGSAHHSAEIEYSFRQNQAFGDFKLMPKDELEVQRRAEYLPNDTLTVCCKMWTGEGDVQSTGKISARSRIRTEKISFYHAVERFSILEPNIKKTIQIKSSLNEEFVISSSLYFLDSSHGEDKIMIETISLDFDCFLHKSTFALLEYSGNLIDCGGMDYGHRTRNHIFPLSLTREDILINKRNYTPGDKLLLLGEYTISTGLVSGAIEENQQELPLNYMDKNSKLTDSRTVCTTLENFSEHFSVSEDMKALYNEQCFSDVNLKTKTKTFAAHKIVLCARSAVFKSMMTSDTKGKKTECIQVDDLEDDTVQQLLLFLYSDYLEPLQWTSATQLYYASDKYAIRKLKALCSSFLVENLTTSNAGDLLLLADAHDDSNLKEIVDYFIFENEEQVLASKEWKKLMETNPQLDVKTMHSKKEKKKGKKKKGKKKK